MSYWRLFYHVIFATKNREPLITQGIEGELHGYLVSKATGLGAIIYAVNSTEDHLHVAASIPPKIVVADFIGQLKGASAYHINHLPEVSQPSLVWSRGYGVLSFGQKQLDYVADYVRRQKERHRTGDLVAALERIEEIDDGPSFNIIEPGDKSPGSATQAP